MLVTPDKSLSQPSDTAGFQALATPHLGGCHGLEKITGKYGPQVPGTNGWRWCVDSRTAEDGGGVLGEFSILKDKDEKLKTYQELKDK